MLSVKGSLFRHRGWWDNNTSSVYIKSIISTGYCLPLKKLPVAEHLRNNKSARDNMNFVDSEIEKLLSSAVIERLGHKPDVVNALTVAINCTGKK
jgi:hypothetical protein